MKSIHSKLQSFKQFEQDSLTKKRQGFDLIDLKYGDGNYIAAYGKNIGKADGFESLTTWSTSNKGLPYLETQIATNKADGYELTDLEYENGYWDSIKKYCRVLSAIAYNTILFVNSKVTASIANLIRI